MPDVDSMTTWTNVVDVLAVAVGQFNHILIFSFTSSSLFLQTVNNERNVRRITRNSSNFWQCFRNLWSGLVGFRGGCWFGFRGLPDLQIDSVNVTLTFSCKVGIDGISGIRNDVDTLEKAPCKLKLVNKILEMLTELRRVHFVRGWWSSALMTNPRLRLESCNTSNLWLPVFGGGGTRGVEFWPLQGLLTVKNWGGQLLELRTTHGWVGNSVLSTGIELMVAGVSTDSKLDGGKSMKGEELWIKQSKNLTSLAKPYYAPVHCRRRRRFPPKHRLLQIQLGY